MTGPPIPTFVVLLCFASGLLLIVLAVPLWLRRIPPNVVYGVRFRATLADSATWYAINAIAGRNLVVIGVGYVGLLSLAQLVGTSWSPAVRVLVPVGFFVAALIANTVLLGRATARWSRAQHSERLPNER